MKKVFLKKQPPKRNIAKIFWYYHWFVKKGYKVYRDLLIEFGDNTNVLVVPWPGTGDAYQTGLYLPEFLSKHKIDDYVLVVGTKSVAKVLALFGLEKRTKVLCFDDTEKLSHFASFVGIKNTKIWLLHHNPPEMHSSMMKQIEGFNAVTWGEMFRDMGMDLDETAIPKLPTFTYDKESIEGVFKEKNLMPGRTVVISPYANTFDSMPIQAWKEIVKRLKRMGYSVCTNSTGPSEPALPGTVPVFFSYAESVPFLEYAGAFIGLRNGLCDIISSAQCAKVILYQNQKCGYGPIIDLFNMKEMGLCSDAHEIEISKKSYMTTVEDVLDCFDYVGDVDNWLVESGQENLKLSVVVPAYNCELYIAECLESILAQDKKEIEIIAIDNGSSDETGLEIDRICAKDSRVRKLRIEPNQGVSHARNEGMKLATGEVIAFCDADDYVPRHAYSTLCARMSIDDADVVVGSYFQVNCEGEKFYCDIREVDEDPIIFFYGGVIWNKIYRKVFLSNNNIAFSGYNYGEDTLFIADCLECNPRFSTVRDAIYHHKQRPSDQMKTQLTRQFSGKNLLDYLECGRQAYTKKFAWQKEDIFLEYIRYLNYVRNFWIENPDCSEQKTTFKDLKDFARLYDWDTPRKRAAFHRIFKVECDKFFQMPYEVYLAYVFFGDERWRIADAHHRIQGFTDRAKKIG